MYRQLGLDIFPSRRHCRMKGLSTTHLGPFEEDLTYIYLPWYEGDKRPLKTKLLSRDTGYCHCGMYFRINALTLN